MLKIEQLPCGQYLAEVDIELEEKEIKFSSVGKTRQEAFISANKLLNKILNGQLKFEEEGN